MYVHAHSLVHSNGLKPLRDAVLVSSLTVKYDGIVPIHHLSIMGSLLSEKSLPIYLFLRAV